VECYWRGKKPNIRRKICTSATLSTQIPQRSDMGLDPPLRCDSKQITAPVLSRPLYYHRIWLENLENINTEYMRFSWRYICILLWRCSVCYKFTGVSGKPLPPVSSQRTSVHLYQNTGRKTW